MGRPYDAGLARKAAEEVANYDQQLNGIRLDLSSIRGELNLLKWMLGIQFAGVAALVLKTFFG